MKNFIVDTNFLLRFLLKDDPKQSPITREYFRDPNNHLIIPIVTLCEAVWVLKKKLKFRNPSIVIIFQALAKQPNIEIEKDLFDIGIVFLEVGGDFADGVIAYQVSQFNNASLLTFDKDARKIAKRLNIAIEEM